MLLLCRINIQLLIIVGKLSHDIEEYSFSQSTLEQVGTNVISKLKMKVSMHCLYFCICDIVHREET